MSGNEITVTAVSVEYASVNAVIKIAKKKDRKLDASNLGLITNGDPTPTVGKDGAPLVAGDYLCGETRPRALPMNVRKVLSTSIRQMAHGLRTLKVQKPCPCLHSLPNSPTTPIRSVSGESRSQKPRGNQSFIENLFSQNIKLLEGGSPFTSDYYLPPLVR